ncbi:MAG: hypothetical protein KKE30_10690 [Gammaproteobacteria bacterium]|nr:hypothetical protein [Gammaproteobacteria bacterium]MBU1553686.1 hypothetical protein [Gammaproteobacteria bacterium]MBU2071404.1 hypothetical protein [Gammaproteobacteria bacterium]MBU2182416.1 hypothetical protein [Gammaproteobacteria bacterium]MBU2204154.1 hypothetical protein [Gammaproteobacteria bacterium]
MNSSNNKYLWAAAICCAAAALAHLGCIVFGADWYRFFGAGEQMARMAEQGLWYPTVMTSVIVVLLVIWAMYALSGAGAIKRLPLTKLALGLIGGIFILRGISFVGLMPMFPENSLTFWLVSSGICLVIGSLFAIGLYQQWSELSKTQPDTAQ